LGILLTGLLAFPAGVGAGPPRYATTDPKVSYVGSAACQGCHQAIYEGYRKTAMGRSMSRARDFRPPGLAEAPVRVKHPRTNRRYEVFLKDGRVFQAEFERDALGQELFRTTHELDYVVGSGIRGLTFILRRGAHLFQAPLSYYASKGKWDLSPGYERSRYGFDRQIQVSCLACHAGRPRPVEGRPGFFQDPPFAELAIGCENCHGPGEAHVNARLQGAEEGGGPRTIFNPATAPARLGENVCMRCHQWGDARVLQPDKTHFDFRPGADLYETLAILKIPPKRSGQMSDLLEHHFAMEWSRCFRASGGELSCFSCHEVHNPPLPDEKAAYYRSKCLQCHEDQNCSLPAEQREAHTPANDCAGCHMPQRELQEIRHTALTNHRIPARPGQPLPEEFFEQSTPGLEDLILVNLPPDAREAALPLTTHFRAYAEMLGEHPEYRAAYLDLLDGLAESEPDHPMALAALGQRAKLEGSPEAVERAAAYFRRAVERGATAPGVYSELAELLGREGRYAEALDTIEAGLDRAPFHRGLSRLRIFALIKLERYAEAEQQVRPHAKLFPGDAEVRNLLRRIEADAGGR